MMQKLGFAKTQFIEQFQKAPWIINLEESLPPHYPYIQNLLENHQIAYVDYLLVYNCLKNHLNADQNVALFLLHLILSSKEGHLCISILNNSCEPPVQKIWINQDGTAINQEEAHRLTQMIVDGSKKIPSALITTEKEDSDNFKSTPVYQSEYLFYLQKNWIFETTFLEHLLKHASTPLILSFDQQCIQEYLSTLLTSQTLLTEQAEAIFSALTHPISLITGGPGRGKTYTAGYLINVVWSHLSPNEKKKFTISLAAPTGKAAANLQKSLSLATRELIDLPPIEAQTLHSLLEVKSHTTSNSKIRLNCDLLIVDESSMIDVKIMSKLLIALKPGSRLVLLGDCHQLPSVEAGSIFADLVDIHGCHGLSQIGCTELKTCVRTDLQVLIEFAELINMGKDCQVLNKLNSSLNHEINRLRFDGENTYALSKQLIAYCASLFPLVVTHAKNSTDLLELFQRIRILSPHKMGFLGFENLNLSIWQYLTNNLPSHGTIAVPIMINTNNYPQKLFNGETGVLIRHLPLQSLNYSDYALFPDRDANMPPRIIPAYLLPPYDLAYCLSVHKSQGSEFDQVILVLPEGSEHFGREVFYTAVTRAKKEIAIYGSDDTIKRTTLQKGLRQSGIKQRLKLA